MDLQQLGFSQTSDTGGRGKAGDPVPAQEQTRTQGLATLEEILLSSDNLPAHHPGLLEPRQGWTLMGRVSNDALYCVYFPISTETSCHRVKTHWPLSLPSAPHGMHHLALFFLSID